MTDNVKAYMAWAPPDSIWSAWAKPVLFADSKTYYASWSPIRRKINWADGINNSTAIIVDLPSSEGVEEALVLARLGFRPVPLYNGVYTRGYNTSHLDSRVIAQAMIMSYESIAEARIKPDAPPAFLLDSNRMTSGSDSRTFDNRWSVFVQDFPSADKLKKEGIECIIVRTKKIMPDLTHILRRYQDANIRIYICDDGKTVA